MDSIPYLVQFHAYPLQWDFKIATNVKCVVKVKLPKIKVLENMYLPLIVFILYLNV